MLPSTHSAHYSRQSCCSLADCHEWLILLREGANGGDEDAARLLPSAFAHAVGARLNCWRCGLPATDYDEALEPICEAHRGL